MKQIFEKVKRIKYNDSDIIKQMKKAITSSKYLLAWLEATSLEQKMSLLYSGICMTLKRMHMSKQA
jgi:hypothetical protein